MPTTSFCHGDISASYLRGLSDHLHQRGIAVDSLLPAESSITDRLYDSEARIACATALTLWQQAYLTTRDRYLGLKVGLEATPQSLSMLSQLVMSSDTLEQAIHYLERFNPLLADWGTVQLSLDDEEAVARYHARHKHFPFAHLAIESAVFSWVRFLVWVLGPELKLKRICFEHECFGEPAVYQSRSPFPVVFAAPYTGLVFEPECLQARISVCDQTLSQTLVQQFELKLAEHQHPQQFQHRIRRALFRLLPQGQHGVQEVAVEVGVSPWTLRRKLNQEGSGLNQLIHQVRIELVESMIGDDSISFTDMTERLGFHEQSSFNRFFREAFSATPRQYREQVVKALTEA